MSKTLSNILTVFKVARIVAKVVFILCIVGGVGCLISLATLTIAGSLLTAEFIVEEGESLTASYLNCITGLITCIGEAVIAFLAERYFKNVLSVGTPFTFDGSKEIFRLGIASIIVSVATTVVLGITLGCFLLIAPELANADVSTSISISTGLFFLFMSLIFKYGAERERSAIEVSTEEKQSSDTESL